MGTCLETWIDTTNLTLSLPILTTSLVHFSLNGWENVLFELSRSTVKRLTLSLPSVINFEFLLQPHQECYITQYGELGFS